MNFLGSASVKVVCCFAKLSSANDRIINQKNLFTFNQLLNRNELHMCNLISDILICRHEGTRPGWCVLNKWTCKRNAAFVCITYGVGSSTVRNSGDSIRVNIVLVAACKITAAVVAHCFNVYALVAGSRVAVVNPEEGTDLHFLTRLLENFHLISIKENNFCRTELMMIRIAQVHVCIVFKACTVSAVLVTDFNWSTAKLVAGSVDSVSCQNQHGNGTLYFLLNEFNSVHDCVFMI